MIAGVLRVPAAAGRLRSELFELGVVDNESYDEHGASRLDVTASQADLERMVARAGLCFDDVLIERRAARMTPRLDASRGQPIA
jgi:GTP-binding protein HflX